MGRTRYNRIKKLLKPIVGEIIHKNKIWRRIIIEVGGSDSTIMETMRLMITLGLIKEVKQDYYKIISHRADI